MNGEAFEATFGRNPAPLAHPDLANPAVLADSGALLRLQVPLAKLCRQPRAGAKSHAAAVWARDLRDAAGVTRVRKSVLGGAGIDRFASELYPVHAPVALQAVPAQARYEGRDPRVLRRAD